MAHQLKFFFQARSMEESGQFSADVEAAIDGGLSAVAGEMGPKELETVFKKLEALVAVLEEPQYVEILSIIENPE